MPGETSDIQGYITWTVEKLERFKKAHNIAVSDMEKGGPDIFVFEDREFFVGYAGYLIEYLERRFGLAEEPEREN